MPRSPISSPPLDPDALWRAASADLRRSLSASAFESWLAPLEVQGRSEHRLLLSGPDRLRSWFERRYRALALAAVRRHDPGVTEIAFALSGADGSRAAALPTGLSRDLRFDRFVIGEGNRLAHAAALAVAERPGEAYNPLFLHGDPGLGKTHLLLSIATYLDARRAELGVHYTTAERFTSEFVTSLRDAESPAGAFKQRYRALGVLLIDDVHFLEGKPRTEDEFFHTFNELYAAGSQLVLSSDRPPEALAGLSDRLRDRFAWGLTVELRPPDATTRRVLLARLASERGLPLTDPAVLDRIAELVPPNLRLLEGALTRITALASILGREPDVGLVDRALASPEAPPPEPEASVEERIAAIQRITCQVLRVPEADLCSPRRAAPLVRARQLAIYIARERTGASLAELARSFHRDHSTILHSLRTVERGLSPGSDLHTAIAEINSRLPAGSAKA